MRRDRESPSIGEIKAFLGEGTEFKGVLSFQGTVRIDGWLEGEVIGDELLIVGESGHLRADIDVGALISSGRIVGNVIARKRVELLATSVLAGKVKTPCLVVAEGASLNGSCEMEMDETTAPADTSPPGEGETG